MIPTEVWPHYYLGKTLFKKEDLTGAKSEFKRALELYPKIEPARKYIDEINLRKSKLGFPLTVEEAEKLTENVILVNHALMEWFETNFRDFVETILEKEYGEKWWRKGVPEKVRGIAWEEWRNAQKKNWALQNYLLCNFITMQR